MSGRGAGVDAAPKQLIRCMNGLFAGGCVEVYGIVATGEIARNSRPNWRKSARRYYGLQRCALNSQPISAMTLSRYIQTSSAIVAPTDPYSTL